MATRSADPQGNMATDVVEWWEALLLTVPGTVVAFAAAFYAPSFAERRTEQGRNVRELLQARRLIGEELERLAQDLRFVSEKDVAFSPDPIGFLQTHEWEAHKATLARLLAGEQTWLAVQRCYVGVIRIRHALAFSAGAPLEPGVPEQMRALARALDVARGALESSTGLAGGALRDRPTVLS